VPHLTVIITIGILIPREGIGEKGEDNTREDKPHNNQPQTMNTNNCSNEFQLTSLQTMHELGFLEFANGTSVIPTRQQEYDEMRKEERQMDSL
jgi:hypothetical protein